MTRTAALREDGSPHEMLTEGDSAEAARSREWEEDSIMVTTDRAFFEEYLAAWNAHDPAAVTRYMADDAIYEDVALGRVLHGPSEIAAFVEEATRSSSDFRFEEV